MHLIVNHTGMEYGDGVGSCWGEL